MTGSAVDKISKPSGDRIRITQSKKFKFPDGKEQTDPFEAIILDHVVVQQYYPGEYKRDEVAPPVCFAIGEAIASMAPSTASQNKQCDTCAACPQNQWGTARQGKGKACKEGRLIAVVPPDFDDETPIWLIQASATALKAYDTYVSQCMANYNAPPIKVITTIGFDPKQDYPTLRFAGIRPNSRIAESVGRMEEARQRLLVEPDYPAPATEPGANRAVAGPAAPGSAFGGRSAARIIK